MKRAAVLLVVFAALVLCVVGSALSAFAIWTIQSSAELIAWARRIDP